MSGNLRFALVRNWGAPLVLAIAALTLGPDAADASCGSYVFVRGRQLHSTHSEMAGAFARKSAAADDSANLTTLNPLEVDESVPARRVPLCHGPSCSNDSVPPAAPAPKDHSTIDRWACTAHAIHIDVNPSSQSFADPDAVQLSGVGLSILRPPR
jgi:hypothetical protein